jgi:hypothetical protein
MSGATDIPTLFPGGRRTPPTLTKWAIAQLGSPGLSFLFSLTIVVTIVL